MTQRYFLWLFVLFLCSSCGTVVKTLAGFKNPKVENKVELSEYFAKVISTEDTFFMKVDEIGNEVEIFTKFGMGFSSDILLFSKDGKKYCYLGTEECGGVQMSKAFQEFNENYAPCLDDEDMNLNAYLENITDLKGNKISKDYFSEADYYIFQHWNKYSGSQKRLKEDLNWLLNLKKNSELNVVVVFVNSDLLEDWGLEKGKELPIKFKKEGNQFSLDFGKLPLKK
jgi:hypothetical protein